MRLPCGSSREAIPRYLPAGEAVNALETTSHMELRRYGWGGSVGGRRLASAPTTNAMIEIAAAWSASSVVARTIVNAATIAIAISTNSGLGGGQFTDCRSDSRRERIVDVRREF
jgi:hypothetical protein